ncbi:MAG: hypothetical protein J0L99_09725 [Chitinophagales bacterium]|nr:hypothetical protein [Chitinophagales bacterium]
MAAPANASQGPPKWGRRLLIAVVIILSFYYIVIEENYWVLSRAIWAFLKSLF